MNNKMIITECPRDAMQGLSKFISTKDKATYINSLLKVGFDVIDFGSFVSPKAVPQMKDTADVLSLLKLNQRTSLLSIVLNKKGADQACCFDEIKMLGYPLSVSEIFQKKNSNKSIRESLNVLDDILNLCIKNNKVLVVYFSMAFGNPYGEKWDKEVLFHYIQKIEKKGIVHVSLADTIGNSDKFTIQSIFKDTNKKFKKLNIGLHLHSHPNSVHEKIESAWLSGCRRFDVAMSGYGGCPFAQDELIGNIPTEKLLNFLAQYNIEHSLDLLAFENAYNKARSIFI